jgi:hypothetical protein
MPSPRQEENAKKIKISQDKKIPREANMESAKMWFRENAINPSPKKNLD